MNGYVTKKIYFLSEKFAFSALLLNFRVPNEMFIQTLIFEIIKFRNEHHALVEFGGD